MYGPRWIREGFHMPGILVLVKERGFCHDVDRQVKDFELSHR